MNKQLLELAITVGDLVQTAVEAATEKASLESRNSSDVTHAMLSSIMDENAANANDLGTTIRQQVEVALRAAVGEARGQAAARRARETTDHAMQHPRPWR